jgi:putative CocE/NonD family hydrolase
MPTTGDIPEAAVRFPEEGCERREVMVPMRDGVRLKMVLVIPSQAVAAPILLDRTPYGTTKMTRDNNSTSASIAMYRMYGELLEAGYIVAMQDIRGKHDSDGSYVMNRPLRGPLNTSGTDHATDAHDTVAWLSANVPESNGHVGIIGVSYDGYTALMALIDPHPALKCVVPINPMVDNWVGDDWFHNGAFRQMITAQYLFVQTGSKSSAVPWPSFRHDEWETWLDAGNASEFGKRVGLDQLPAWNRLLEHPAYDDFWQAQAVDRLLAERAAPVPTLHVHSQWDAEDIDGSIAVHAALSARNPESDGSFLVIGPWSHPGVAIDDGTSLGAVRFGSATALTFRQTVLRPFLDTYLRGSDHAAPPRVCAFETGSNTWRRHESWPPAATSDVPWFLREGGALSTESPPDDAAASFDQYLSDPAKPVPYQPRPIRPKGTPGARWHEWLVDDQRFADGRTDVLTYRSTPLSAPLHLAGQPVVDLYAATTGTDSDWVVKLIDVHPDNVAGDVAMGGYQLPLAMEIFRGRYRVDPARPQPLEPGAVLRYTLRLPHVSHAILPGHRLMVQIQSSWFPLYDRNPQTFVPSIFFAPPEAYVSATQSVHRSALYASCIHLPVLSG